MAEQYLLANYIRNKLRTNRQKITMYYDKNKQLEGHSVERMYLRQVFSRLVVNKTMLKPRLPAATAGRYLYVGFSRRNEVLSCSAYTISEKAIRFRHPDYNPDWAQKLISSSMSRHLSTQTCNISSKSMHVFLSNLANRQTDRQCKGVRCPPIFSLSNLIDAGWL